MQKNKKEKNIINSQTKSLLIEHLGNDWAKVISVCDNFILGMAPLSKHLISNVDNDLIPVAIFYKIINEIKEKYINDADVYDQRINNIELQNSEMSKNLKKFQQYYDDYTKIKNENSSLKRNLENEIDASNKWSSDNKQLRQDISKLSEEYDKTYNTYQKLLSEHDLLKHHLQSNLDNTQDLLNKIHKLKIIISGIINEL